MDQIRKDYERADKAEKRRLLDEAERRAGLNRKYLICGLGNRRNDSEAATLSPLTP